MITDDHGGIACALLDSPGPPGNLDRLTNCASTVVERAIRWIFLKHNAGALARRAASLGASPFRCNKGTDRPSCGAQQGRVCVGHWLRRAFVDEQIAATFPEVSFYAVDTAFTDESIAHYRARLSVRNVFLSSSLDSAVPHLKGQVSLVILMDVLEHVEDDYAFLTHLMTHPRIGSNAYVLVTVRVLALFCSHDKFLGHHWRYSNQQLRDLLESSGLAVIEVGYFFSSLVLARTLQVLKERWLFRKANDSATTGLVTWNGGPTSPPS